MFIDFASFFTTTLNSTSCPLYVNFTNWVPSLLGSNPEISEFWLVKFTSSISPLSYSIVPLHPSKLICSPFIYVVLVGGFFRDTFVIDLFIVYAKIGILKSLWDHSCPKPLDE